MRTLAHAVPMLLLTRAPMPVCCENHNHNARRDANANLQTPQPTHKTIELTPPPELYDAPHTHDAHDNNAPLATYHPSSDDQSKPPLLGDASRDETENIVADAIALAACSGLVVGGTEPNTLAHAPFSLLPAAVPAAELARAYELAPLFNKLVERVAADLPWLEQTLRLTARSDDFTGRLLKMCSKVHGEGLAQKAVFAVLRSDYMLHEPAVGKASDEAAAEPRLLQVELNTIASSFGSLSTRVSELHRSLAQRWPPLRDALWRARGSPRQLSLAEALPRNEALGRIAEGLALAHREYCAQPGSNAADAAVLFVVQPGERNFADQRLLQQRLFDDHAVPSIFRSLAQVEHAGRLDSRRSLRVDGAEVSVSYFRAGYTPDDYPTAREWAARLLLERSRAIKCPSLAYHLTGAKKVQQALAQPGELERFVSVDEAAALRSVFAGLWSLSGSAGDTDPEAAAAIADALERPGRYVMKPQREGGGNNLFGDELVTALRSMTRAQRAAYILMQRIEPRPQSAILVRNGELLRGDAISELGVYSTFVRSASGRVLADQAAGHLVRTKLEGVNEGGVAAGFAVLSSPMAATVMPGIAGSR